MQTSRATRSQPCLRTWNHIFARILKKAIDRAKVGAYRGRPSDRASEGAYTSLQNCCGVWNWSRRWWRGYLYRERKLVLLGKKRRQRLLRVSRANRASMLHESSDLWHSRLKMFVQKNTRLYIIFLLKFRDDLSNSTIRHWVWSEMHCSTALFSLSNERCNRRINQSS